MVVNEEVEIKIAVENQTETEKRLRASSRFVKERKQEDRYFVPHDRDYFSESPVSEYVRVRFEDGKNHFSYSKCHFDAEGKLLKADEYEALTPDPETACEILAKTRMVQRVVVRKTRKCFEHGDFELAFDEVDGLGFFLEVEAKKLLGSAEETKQKCFSVLEELGVRGKEAKDKGYPDMVLEKTESK